MTTYSRPNLYNRQDETLTELDRRVFVFVQHLITLCKIYPDKSDEYRAVINATVSENALSSRNTPRGALITMLVYRFPHYVDLCPIADALGVMPSSLRTALGLEAKR